MKLATLKDGSRDGQLAVVSRDLSIAQHAAGVATRLQTVLDDWRFFAPQLEEIYQALNRGAPVTRLRSIQSRRWRPCRARFNGPTALRT